MIISEDAFVKVKGISIYPGLNRQIVLGLFKKSSKERKRLFAFQCLHIPFAERIDGA